MSKKTKLFLSFLLLLSIILSWIIFRLFSPFAEKTSIPLTLTVNQNEGIFAISERLANLSQNNEGTLKKIEVAPLAFLMSLTQQIKPGDYEFPATMKLSLILNKLIKGDVVAQKIRIPEGVTWREIKTILNTANLTHDMQNLNVTQAAQVLKIDSTSIEGMIFPDTYHYKKSETESSFLSRAHQLLLKKLNAAWLSRTPDLPYKTPYEALILASIIEKETGTANDRALVAAVFINRLKIPMRLQTDPSIIYGMGEEFTGNITKADLRRDTPFNTYTRIGLTPTPIATVSLASINAALNPASSDALYFVARGDGSSEFSHTLSEHNTAVQKYQINRTTQTIVQNNENP